MKINGMGRVMEVYAANSYNKSVEKSQKSSKRDELQLSPGAKFHQVAMAELKSMPDVREDKVAAIKASVDSGSYNIDSRAIAEKMYKMSKGIY